MFATFFHELKAAKVPVTLKEYLTLMEAMQAAGRHGVFRSFDLNYRSKVEPNKERAREINRSIVPHTDFLVGNQSDFFDALGYEPPLYLHHSLLLGPDGAKMSKRHGATTVREYREAGYLPAALANYLAMLDETRRFS